MGDIKIDFRVARHADYYPRGKERFIYLFNNLVFFREDIRKVRTNDISLVGNPAWNAISHWCPMQMTACLPCPYRRCGEGYNSHSTAGCFLFNMNTITKVGEILSCLDIMIENAQETIEKKGWKDADNK